jgi:hypothetical protein
MMDKYPRPIALLLQSLVQRAVADSAQLRQQGSLEWSVCRYVSSKGMNQLTPQVEAARSGTGDDRWLIGRYS